MRFGRYGLVPAAALSLFAGSLSACTSDSRQPAATAASRAATTAASTAVPSSPVESRSSSRAPAPSTAPAPHAAALPVGGATGESQQVITVAAPEMAATRAVLRAWRRVASGWVPVGPEVPAWLGGDGLTTHASESSTATPVGSFTLTRAFGRNANPGTTMPYRQTTPADWWISQPGPQYNTFQHCSAGCRFTQGSPNEHLYYEVPYYRYAVVLDYNTANAPGGIRQGAGSAFFLHVTVGAPTQGCVSIPEDQLVRLLRWLSPAAHPRMLIGVHR